MQLNKILCQKWANLFFFLKQLYFKDKIKKQRTTSNYYTLYYTHVLYTDEIN